MLTPKFFYQKPRFAFLLLPFSLVFWVISQLRKLFIKERKLQGKFVICVGNLTLGGAGKTPSALFLGEILKKKGLSFCFLTRGYGRETTGFIKASPRQSAIEVGDEPLLLLKTAPVYLFSKYSEIFQNIREIKEKVVIMDDGLQNPAVFKDYKIIVVDGKFSFGNGLLFPAGPLREPLYNGLLKADMVFEIGHGGSIKNFTLKSLLKHNTFILNRKYELPHGIPKNTKLLAFSGLALNQKFFNSLKELGLNVVKTVEFQDHHFYTEEELESLLKEGLQLITTEKDIVKIPPQFQKEILVLKLKLQSSQINEIEDKLLNSIKL